MCHTLFLGSSAPLPLVSYPDVVWFGVEALCERHEAIRLHFPPDWHVYYLNSHEGCGCGFHADEQFPDEDESYDEESRSHLIAYLRAAKADPAVAIALYDCWEGDQKAPILTRIEATVDELAARPDPVPEGTWVTVT